MQPVVPNSCAVFQFLLKSGLLGGIAIKRFTPLHLKVSLVCPLTIMVTTQSFLFRDLKVVAQCLRHCTTDQQAMSSNHSTVKLPLCPFERPNLHLLSILSFFKQCMSVGSNPSNDPGSDLKLRVQESIIGSLCVSPHRRTLG